MSDRARILTALALLIAFAAFAGGAIWAKTKVWPYSLFREAWNEYKFLRSTNFGTRPSWRLPRARAGEGVTVHVKGRPAEGLTLISGGFMEGPHIRLVDLDGNIVNDWSIEFDKLWPNPTHIHRKSVIPKFKFGFAVHGLLADPEGNLIFNIDGLGLARIDRCGRVLWTVNRRTHHSIALAEDDTYWVLAYRDASDIDPDLYLPGRDAASRAATVFDETYDEYEDLLLHVLPDGKVIGEISVLRALLKVATWPELFPVSDPTAKRYEPTHTNDIEIVTPELAARVPAARAGDLLISLRNLNMLAIIDPGTGEMVWRHAGPWVHQHDPDILHDGRISLYDNNDNYSDVQNRKLPGSRIVQYTPDTDEVRVVIPSQKISFYFYSRIMGRHQYLPNGDLLVLESLFGSVTEFAPDGALVWQYVQPLDDKWAAIIGEAERYPPDFFKVSNWSCPGN